MTAPEHPPAFPDEAVTRQPAAEAELARLLSIMAALRTPGTGCAWDLEQDFRSIAPYTLEEAYEVADAIERDDMVDLVDELGDLQLQVVFHARMAEEAGHFAFADVLEAINSKMIRRHPHVFGSADARSAGMAKGAWDRIKAEEKRARAARHAAAGQPVRAPGLLGAVPIGMPGLTRAVKLQDRAGSVGFDCNDPVAVIAKIREELDEVEATLAQASPDRHREEIGDLLFVIANLARHLDVDPEAALLGANEKFLRRFAHIEARLAEQGSAPADSTLEEMDALWNEARAADKKAP